MDRGGRVLGGCVLHEQVGSGASGAVYRAVQQSLGREVAVKVLRGRDRQALERFRREAEVTSRLNSRNIAQIIDFGTSPEGESYFIMELLHGEDLASRLERVGRLELEAALGITEEIARALRLAHDHHVVHRDLKPQNIFLHQTLDDGEVVKVIDFGVSRILARRGNGPGPGVASGALDDGELVGSPLYMAPEQIDGREGAVDERSDVYALGACVYEMLTGRSPYAGAGSLFELLAAIMGPQPPPDPAALAPELPRAVARAVVHALEKRPEARPASVTAFFNELRHAARGREATAPRPTAALVGTQRVGTTFVSGTLVAPLWRKRRIPDELRFAVPEGGFEDGVPGARSLELAPGRSEWFVGRHPACELVLPHSRVSRRAVRVTLRAGRAQLCRLRECTVPVRVGLASLAPGDERPLHHGEPVAIGAVSGVFLDGRYVPPQVSPQDLDVETGLLGRDGLAWELGLALRMDERARLFVVTAAHADGGDAELAVRAALALHARAPERPVARIDGVAAVLLAADEAPEPLLEALLCALAPPSSDRPAAPSPAAPAAPGELVAGIRLVTGTSDEAGARLDETCRALERLAAPSASASGAARGVVDLAAHVGSPPLGPEELGAVARACAEAGGSVTLFVLEDAPRLARLGRGVFEALELELAELV
ncbi:MAG: serine/threonine protein kinase, partial [Myxococcales bacterium]|nr:serine/threonine protein kinase [Myxococcales bacterium]